jgi:uncharacterized protein YegP (UPF0339 family)
MRFVIYQDNRGQFHWRLTGDDGIEYAASVVAFDSRQDARWAAADVHMRARSAIAAEP